MEPAPEACGNTGFCAGTVEPLTYRISRYTISIMSKRIETYEVVSGTRVNPGVVLKSFTSATVHKCGGPATAALRWFDAHRGEQVMFFRKAH